MTCEKSREAFGAYLYDEIEKSERQRLEAHIKGCPGCRRELETEQRFINALSRRMRELSEEVTR